MAQVARFGVEYVAPSRVFGIAPSVGLCCVVFSPKNYFDSGPSVPACCDAASPTCGFGVDRSATTFVGFFYATPSRDFEFGVDRSRAASVVM